MNCNTGEITNNPELIKAWRDAGVPVLDLPNMGQRMIEFVGDPVPEEEKPSVLKELGFEVVDLRAKADEATRREANNLKLRILAGRGR